MEHSLLRWFTWQHLPPNLQNVCSRIRFLAEEMDEALQDGPEKTEGMRKLLEAKDCFVRQAVADKANVPGV